MRVLCLVGACPLPVASAEDERLVSQLEVLASMATLEVVIRGSTTAAQRARVHEHLGGAVVDGLPEIDARARGGRLRWLTHRDVPVDVALVDPRPARRTLRRVLHADERPDAVFASDVVMAWLARPVVPPVPWFVDLPRVHGPSPWSGPVSSSSDAVGRVRGRSIVELLVVDRQARFELREAAAAHLLTVRSAADRDALGVPGAVVLNDDAVAGRYVSLVRAALSRGGRYAPKAWL